ncbi:MAG: prepilin peptidase, partial [Candidatus Diapherotrites archaeon]|nr:prepilin peptidase [Candidatus Diapherotrites archaeon]
MKKMELLLLREVLVIAATAIAAWTDWKTGNIYDWLTYPLIAIGVVLNLIELNFLGLGLGAGVFAIGYLLYYTGRLGGGDVKLFAGITMALPFLQGKVYIIPVLLYSALIAVMFFSVYYTVKLARLKKLELKENSKGIFNAAIIAIALAA